MGPCYIQTDSRPCIFSQSICLSKSTLIPGKLSEARCWSSPMTTPPLKPGFRKRIQSKYDSEKDTLGQLLYKPFRSLKPGYEGSKTFLRVIERSGDVFPPLKSAVAGLLGVCDIIDLTSQNQQDMGELKKRLEDVVSIVHSYHPPKKGTYSEPFARRLEGLSSALLHQISVINAKDGRSYVHRLAESSSDASDIVAVYRTLSNLLQAFTINTSLSIEENSQRILLHTSLALLDKLRHVPSAVYNASSPTKRHGCTEKTRVSILAGLVSWATDPMDTKIYWLNGMAGTGKTTISYSFSEILDKNSMLGASFFCSRLESDTGSVDRIFPTIAHQLALRFPSVYDSLISEIESDPGIAAKSLPIQFRNIIVGPLRAAEKDLNKKPVVITIEALDECSDQDEVNRLLEIISQYSSTLPVKFFITSRPEKHIRRGFNNRNFGEHSKFILHNVEKDVVKADIELFARGRLMEIAEGYISLEGWPPEYQLQILVEMAGNLFIYAATACAYISEGNIRDRLSLITTISREITDGETAILDDLYNTIVTAAYNKANTQERKIIKIILQAVVNIQRPLSIITLGTLFALSNEQVEFAVSSLHSVIHIPFPIDFNGPISTLHASFPDFITTESRAGTNYMERSESHCVLALRCLGLMHSSFQGNTFRAIGQPQEINSRLIKERISDGLAYACTYWVFHAAETSIGAPDLRSGLLSFFDHIVMRWIECLSVIGQIGIVIVFLRRLESRIQADREIWAALMDTRRFLTENFEIIAKYGLETYRSALVWLPEQSRIRKRYQGTYPWKLMIGRRRGWDTCEAVLVGHKADVNSVAFSPDGSRIASGSDDRTIRISDASTGVCEVELVGHTGRVWSVAFSPDGGQIATGSSDGTVRIWKVVTGECEANLEGGEGGVNSVAFSSDGSHVVSGCDGRTVCIWNITTGECEVKMMGHSDRVWSVAFSADGSCVTSGSGDKTVGLWNASTGECKAKMTGHLDTVRSVIFSPDGVRVISGSEDTKVRIWISATGECEAMLEGHTGAVFSVALSVNGRHILSGSRDKTVRVWNMETRETEAILEGHSDAVYSVARSPEGTRIISGSYDNSIRIWNFTAMGETNFNQLGHTDRIRSLAFSPDGSSIASASDDKTIRIWSVASGDCEVTLVGHSGDIDFVAFSPDGRRVLSGYSNNTARIWNIATGQSEVEMKGHTGSLRAVAFAPDGGFIVSGSVDNTIRFWNAKTGECRFTLDGHSDSVTSIAFSSDNSFVASGSDDRTIHLWNARTGSSMAVLTGHSPVEAVAFSPSGDYVVSLSYDQSVRVWNMKTQECEAKLVERDWIVQTALLPGDTTTLANQAILPDGTVVHWSSKHLVIISAHSAPSLYCNDEYIHCREIDQRCWIPPQFRNPETISYHQSKIGLGYHSGLVVVMEYVSK